MIPDTLSWLANANDFSLMGHSTYSKLDALFVYSTSLVEIKLKLLKQIIKRYNVNNRWSKILAQVIANEELGPRP